MKKPVLASLVLLFLFGCSKNNDTKTPKTPPPVIPFTISADSVFLNPSGNAPLSALIRFTSPVSGHTVITVTGKHGTASDITQTFSDNGTYHVIPILGLYAGTTNTVQVSVVSGTKTVTTSVKITTAVLPSDMPAYINIDEANRTAMEPGLNLVSSLSTFSDEMPYMLDSFGDIRWYLDFTNNTTLNQLFYDCGINRLKNGNFRFVDQHTQTIYEVDILGKIINKWALGVYGFHHDMYEKPNGNFLVTVSKPGSTHPDGASTIEDYIIEINRTSGDIINTWDLKQSINEYRQVLNNDPTDWAHTNGVIYDPSDNTIIISCRVQGVFKLTQDNRVKWVMGPHRGWGMNHLGQDLSKLLLTPLDATGTPITDTSIVNGWRNSNSFEWNWYQHSPQLIPNGDLMVFDNGQYRNYSPNLSNYSRAVEFKINQTNMTVQQIWEYGKERGADTFSQIVSSVKYLPATNHILFSPGFNVPNATGSGGKIIEVNYATKAIVFQASVSNPSGWGWHRVQRIPIYPNGEPYKQ